MTKMNYNKYDNTRKQILTWLKDNAESDTSIILRGPPLHGKSRLLSEHRGDFEEAGWSVLTTCPPRFTRSLSDKKIFSILPETEFDTTGYKVFEFGKQSKRPRRTCRI